MAWRLVSKDGVVRAGQLHAALALCSFTDAQIDRLNSADDEGPCDEMKFCATYDALVAAGEAPLEEAIECAFAMFDDDDAVDGVSPPATPTAALYPLPLPTTEPKGPADSELADREPPASASPSVTPRPAQTRSMSDAVLLAVHAGEREVHHSRRSHTGGAGTALSADVLVQTLGPLSHANVQRLLAELHVQPGQPVRARALAVALRSELEIAQIANRAAGTRDARTRDLLDGRAGAIKAVRAELSAAERAVSERGGARALALVCEVLGELGVLVHASAQRAQAELCFRRSLALLEAAPGANAGRIADAADALAAVHAELGFVRSAYALRNQALAARAKIASLAAAAAAAAEGAKARGAVSRGNSYAAAALARAQAATKAVAGPAAAAGNGSVSPRAAHALAEPAELVASLRASLAASEAEHARVGDSQPETLVLLKALERALRGAGEVGEAEAVHARFTAANEQAGAHKPVSALLATMDADALRGPADADSARYQARYLACLTRLGVVAP